MKGDQIRHRAAVVHMLATLKAVPEADRLDTLTHVINVWIFTHGTIEKLDRTAIRIANEFKRKYR